MEEDVEMGSMEENRGLPSDKESIVCNHAVTLANCISPLRSWTLRILVRVDVYGSPM
jgi:hypothetical protein